MYPSVAVLAAIALAWWATCRWFDHEIERIGIRIDRRDRR